MKQQVLSFIDKLKSLFSEKKNSMPKFGPHKPYLVQINQDEAELTSAKQIIEKLDDSNQKTFADSLFFYFIEKVVPVFRKWNGRLKVIAENSANGGVLGHIKARNEFAVERVVAYQLLTQINAMNDGCIIPVPEGDAETQGKAILNSYTKEGYLEKHVVEVPQDKAANDEVTLGTLPTLN
ncbi:MAG: hypothetical protein AB7I18_13170 [Candidatus Berkiella sp.]